jgi:HNH/ENDO VII superfamily nuclease with conserved GHE residues
VSADPLAIHGLGADLNLYAYVSGMALKATDPLGLDPTTPPPSVWLLQKIGMSSTAAKAAAPWVSAATGSGAADMSAQFITNTAAGYKQGGARGAAKAWADTVVAASAQAYFGHQINVARGASEVTQLVVGKDNAEKHLDALGGIVANQTITAEGALAGVAGFAGAASPKSAVASSRVTMAELNSLETQALKGLVDDPVVTLKGTNARGVVTSRGSFRVGTVSDAWENAEPGPTGGRLCPTCKNEVHVPAGSETPRDWDVSHQPSWTNREFPADVTRDQVIDNYQQGTSLECPGCNRSRGNNDPAPTGK